MFFEFCAQWFSATTSQFLSLLPIRSCDQGFNFTLFRSPFTYPFFIHSEQPWCGSIAMYFSIFNGFALELKAVCLKLFPLMWNTVFIQIFHVSLDEILYSIQIQNFFPGNHNKSHYLQINYMVKMDKGQTAKLIRLYPKIMHPEKSQTNWSLQRLIDWQSFTGLNTLTCSDIHKRVVKGCSHDT